MKLGAFLCALMMPVASFGAMPHIGLYQTIDDETNRPKSIVALYDHDGRVAGRIVALYDASGAVSETVSAPVRRAPGIDGSPYYAGLDIIWDMRWDADLDKYVSGRVMDPTKGKTYNASMWQDAPGTLSVRGRLGPFYRTQTWRALSDADAPADLRDMDTSTWQPRTRK